MYDRMMIGIRMLAATAAWISATTFAEGKRIRPRWMSSNQDGMLLLRSSVLIIGIWIPMLGRGRLLIGLGF